MGVILLDMEGEKVGRMSSFNGIEVIENPTDKQLEQNINKVDAIIAIPSIESEEIESIVSFYENYNTGFEIIYIHKYSKEANRIETVFGMKKV